MTDSDWSVIGNVELARLRAIEAEHARLKHAALEHCKTWETWPDRRHDTLVDLAAVLIGVES